VSLKDLVLFFRITHVSVPFSLLLGDFKALVDVRESPLSHYKCIIFLGFWFSYITMPINL